MPSVEHILAPVALWSRRAVLLGTAVTYLCAMGALGGFAVVSKDLPDPEKLWERNRPVSVQILDRQGRDLDVRGAVVEKPVDLDALPFHIPLSVLAIEDRRYRNHAGVDPVGLSRAMWRNLRAGHLVEGGSTITQQLTKNVFLSHDQTLPRKAQEMMLALWLERDFTKDELLEMYLSRVYFGNGAWGLEAASESYFGKPAAELTLAESALLAGLLKAPSRLNPARDPAAAQIRQRIVLEAMERQNLLDEGVLELALAEPLELASDAEAVPAGHFIDWIWADLEDRLGVPTQDLVVQTTLDRDAQIAAHAALTTHLDPERGATEGSIITLDGSGGVRVMIGGADYARSQFNRAVQANRQPGSSFKPFVYLAALRAGLSPWSRRVDAPITIGDWTPENFTEDHLGEITLETALAKSINTVAVSLTEEIGRERVVATAADLGLSDLKPYRSLALGAQGVSPLALTESYLPFATQGRRATAFGILSVSTPDGTPLYDHRDEDGPLVLSPDEIAQMNTLFVSAVEAGTGRRARIDGRMIGGKTGTTNDFRDAWFVGYAPDMVTSVWVGSDENKAMARVTGGSIPALIFHDTMAPQLAQLPPARLPLATEPEWARQDTQLDSLLDRISGQLP